MSEQEPLRWSSVKIGTIQRRLAWPLRKDDTHKSRSIALLSSAQHTHSVPHTPHTPHILPPHVDSDSQEDPYANGSASQPASQRTRDPINGRQTHRPQCGARARNLPLCRSVGPSVKRTCLIVYTLYSLEYRHDKRSGNGEQLGMGSACRFCFARRFGWYQCVFVGARSV